MNKNYVGKILFGLFLIIGVIFSCIGIIWLCHSFKVSKSTLETKGVISRIEAYRDKDGDLNHVAYVIYEAEGQVFEDVPLNFYSSSMNRGDAITVYYLPDNPGKPYSKGSMWFGPAIFSGLGIIFVIIGLCGVIAGILHGTKIKQLKESGISLSATVEEISMNLNYKMNGSHPYIISCSYTDDYSGVTYHFKSGNLWENPGNRYPVGSTVKVLVNPKDYGLYYVDVENGN